MYGGCLHKLPAKSNVVRPQLRIVRCIVARPCCVACLSFLIPVILSVIGWRIIITNSGPSGPFLQMNYPTGDPIAKQSNAFVLALEDAGAVRVSSLDGGSQRMLAEAGAQVQQSETMSTALFSFRAYDEDGDSFSQAGLSELCGLHTSLLGAGNYDDFCLREKVVVNGTQLPGDCAAPVTPLAFFYGPASYDPSSIDLAVFDIPKFDDIVRAFITHLPRLQVRM